MNIKVIKLEFTVSKQEYGKFTIILTREANFTKCPAAYPFSLECCVEWECIIELLEEFYQNEYAYQLSNNQQDDDEYFKYPTWADGESHHESKSIEEWIDNGDTKEFAQQFCQKYIDEILLETQYDFKAEMKIVLRSQNIAA